MVKTALESVKAELESGKKMVADLTHSYSEQFKESISNTQQILATVESLKAKMAEITQTHRIETKALEDANAVAMFDMEQKLAVKDLQIVRMEEMFVELAKDIRDQMGLPPFGEDADPSKRLSQNVKTMLDEYLKKSTEAADLKAQLGTVKEEGMKAASDLAEFKKKFAVHKSDERGYKQTAEKLQELVTVLVDQQVQLNTAIKRIKCLVLGTAEEAERKKSEPKEPLQRVRELLGNTRREITELIMGLYSEMHNQVYMNSCDCMKEIKNLSNAGPTPSVDRLGKLLQDEAKRFAELSQAAGEVNFFDSAKGNGEQWAEFETETQKLVKEAQTAMKTSMENAGSVMAELKVAATAKEAALRKEQADFKISMRNMRESLKAEVEQLHKQKSQFLAEQIQIKAEKEATKKKQEDAAVHKAVLNEKEITLQKEIVKVKKEQENIEKWTGVKNGTIAVLGAALLFALMFIFVKMK